MKETIENLLKRSLQIVKEIDDLDDFEKESVLRLAKEALRHKRATEIRAHIIETEQSWKKN